MHGITWHYMGLRVFTQNTCNDVELCENTWNGVKLREIHRKYLELREIQAQGGRMKVPSARTGQPGAGRRRWATPERRLTPYNTLSEWHAGAHTAYLCMFTYIYVNVRVFMYIYIFYVHLRIFACICVYFDVSVKDVYVSTCISACM